MTTRRTIQADKRHEQHSFCLRVPIRIRAAAEAEGEGATPGFSMVAYTGGPLRLSNWKFPIVVELSGLEGLDRQRPILRDHDRGKIVGHTTSIRLENGELLADGLISGANQWADEVRESGKNEFPWQASIGADVLVHEFVPAGRTAQANGRDWDGPIFIARRTSLGEISFVALGADQDTSATIVAQEATGATAMTFEQFCQQAGFDPATLTDAQKAFLMKQYEASQATAADEPEGEPAAADGEEPEGEPAECEGDEPEGEPATARKGKASKASRATGRRSIRAQHAGRRRIAAIDPDAIGRSIRAQVAAEHKRMSKLQTICAQHPQILDQALDGDWDEARTELEVLRASRPQQTIHASFGINTGAGQLALTNSIVAAGCALSSGVSEKYALAGLDDRAKELAASKQLRHQTIFGLCTLIAASHGRVLRSGRMDNDTIREMFSMDIQAASGFSTLSLSGITENILNKGLLQAYGSVDDVIKEFCFETDTNDFKQFKRYRLTASGEFAVVGADGELKNLSLQDESYANQLHTRGVIITITRPMLINDDLGAITQLPQVLGRGAAISRAKLGFTLLRSGTTTTEQNSGTPGYYFFSAGAKNYLSGGTSALSLTSLATAVQKFMEQKDANGDPIMVSPDRLLVPPALVTTAEALYNGANLVVTSLGATNAKATEPNLNAHRGKYRPIPAPFMGAQQSLGSLGAGSDTAWCLLTNPTGGFAPVQIGYLRGQRTPVIESGEASFNTLGMQSRCYFDIGGALHDHRTAVWSAGA